MPAIVSKLDPASAAFAANTQRMAERLAEVQRLEGLVIAESESKRARFEQRGQLLPRERVARLLDRGSGFLELSRLAGLNMHDDDGRKAVLGGGSIVGIGTVAGKRVLISASDSGVKGGTVAPMGLKKALRAQEIARENKLPLVYLVESGGANLMYQAEIFVDGGRSFANQARLSAAGIPQIAVVHGSSTAGGAYLPGLSDYVVLVRGRSSIYLAGPPLVKAAIGEDATDEELGGAQTHAEVTGLGEYLCENDAHAIALTRELLDKLPWEAAGAARPFAEPLFDEEELMGIVPADEREPYDVREVIARLVDGRLRVDRVERRKLDRRHIKARCLGLLNEDLGGLLVQAADEMPGHVERVHHGTKFAGRVGMRNIGSRLIDKYTYGLDGIWYV